MKTEKTFIIICCCILLFAVGSSACSKKRIFIQKKYHCFLALKKAYSEYIDTCLEGKVFFKDKSYLVYDDGEKKNFIDKLNNSDIEDMFCIEYKTSIRVPSYLEDAGRIRSDCFFRKIYGNTREEVEKNLDTLNWFGSTIKVNRKNDVIYKLKKVREELKNDVELSKYLIGSAGSYYWRKISGTDRLSMHSYGIAIDINVEHSSYWRWSNPNASELDTIEYENRIPLKIVHIFERYGFIWGGRWYHFDTMHFEYRPELLLYHEISIPTAY
ncbi:MAG TPA: hypothetical protein DDY68_02230 [Porphyromonadaceae bacterium]|nr:hypothetical protein [Porphyromonadaceae bacterium]